MLRVRSRQREQLWRWVSAPPPWGDGTGFTGDKTQAAIFAEELPWMWDAEFEVVEVSEAEIMEAQGQKPLFDLEATNG